MAETVHDTQEARPVHRSAPTTRRSAVAWAAVIVAAVVLAAFIALVAARGGDEAEAVVVEVPSGTGERLDAGEIVEVLEPVVHLETGQALEIDNDDRRLHVIGSLSVEAGGTARQVFDSEGRYVVGTSLRSDGLVTILVEDRAG